MPQSREVAGSRSTAILRKGADSAGPDHTTLIAACVKDSAPTRGSGGRTWRPAGSAYRRRKERRPTAHQTLRLSGRNGAGCAADRRGSAETGEWREEARRPRVGIKPGKKRAEPRTGLHPTDEFRVIWGVGCSRAVGNQKPSALPHRARPNAPPSRALRRQPGDKTWPAIRLTTQGKG